MTKIQLRAKQLAFLFLMLTSLLMCFSFLPKTKALMQVLTVSPGSGNVGTNVTVTANVTTANGQYKIYFNTTQVATGTASGNNVSASFLVPAMVRGNYNVTVVDVTKNENATFSTYFNVTTAFFLNVTVPAAPAQYQEGDSIPIFYNATGDSANDTVHGDIEVVGPDSSYDYEPLVFSTSAVGSGSGMLDFPGSFNSSSSRGANTGLVGVYTVSDALNGSTVSPVGFIVGLTNSTEYHRYQTVDIRATGYAPDETLTINMTGTNVQYSVNQTASPTGEINFTGFVVPENATVGNYTVRVSEVEILTGKTVSDVQTFTVPGFAFNVTTVNLAGEPVPFTRVVAYETSASLNGTVADNETADSSGLAVLTLEVGIYNLTGYYQNTFLGENITSEVNNTEVVNLELNLTDLGVTVVAKVNNAEVGIPEAQVSLSPTDVTLTTDINGNAEQQSLIPNDSYVLTASRYGITFNETSIIQSSSGAISETGNISSLLINGTAPRAFNVTIACPSYALQIQAFEAGGQPFSNATVEAKELVGGIAFENTTGSNGVVTFPNAPFGEYYVEILDSAGTLLNSTTVTLFQANNATVTCNLYGLSISVTVTDYLGQPFGNTEVTLQGNVVGSLSDRTQPNGTVTFANLIGNNYVVSVYLSNNGSPNVVEDLLVSGSTAITIHMNNYILFAGDPVGTVQLEVAVIIVLAVLLVVVFEVFRRRRVRGRKQAVDSK